MDSELSTKEKKEKEEEVCNISKNINPVWNNIQDSMIKRCMKQIIPGQTLSLGGGLPANDTFPVKSITVQLESGENFVLKRNDLVTGMDNMDTKMNVNDDDDNNSSSNIFELNQQYHMNSGLSDFRLWIKDFMREFHTPYLHHDDLPKKKIEQEQVNEIKDWWDISLTVGSTQGLFAILHQFQMNKNINVNNYDYDYDNDNDSYEIEEETEGIFLAEKYFWAAVENQRKIFNYHVIGIDCDQEGILPIHLEETLYEIYEINKKKVSFLMLTPQGQNPQGLTMSMERKKQIYEVCVKYDIFIVEDDAYWFVSYGSGTSNDNNHSITDVDNNDNNNNNNNNHNNVPGLYNLPKSFLSIDKDGRVIRLDSFSKWMAPGVRTGWITGSKAYISNYYRIYTGISVQFPSNYSQLIALGTLKSWGRNGLNKHITSLQLKYQSKRDSLHQSLLKHMCHKYMEWTLPKAGIFLWLKLQDCYVSYINEISDNNPFYLFKELLKEDILAVPGFAFASGEKTNEIAVRLSFAGLKEEQLTYAGEKISIVLSRIFTASKTTTTTISDTVVEHNISLKFD